MFKWDPEPGKLFVRETFSGVELIEVHLACIVRPRLHPSAGLPYTILLEQEYGVTKPNSMCSFVDYTYSKEEMVNERVRVVRRLADNQDLHLLMERWDKTERCQPDEWMERVAKRFMKETNLLSQPEFDRLNGIAQQHLPYRHPFNKRNSQPE